MRTQNGTDLAFHDAAHFAFGLTFTARTQSLAVLDHVVDPVEHEGIDFQTTVIGGGNFDHRGFQRQDPVFVAHDLIQEGHFEADARLVANLFDLAKTQHQRFFALVHDEDSRKDTHDGDHQDGNDKTCFPHQFDPPPRRNSLSGR